MQFRSDGCCCGLDRGLGATVDGVDEALEVPRCELGAVDVVEFFESN